MTYVCREIAINHIDVSELYLHDLNLELDNGIIMPAIWLPLLDFIAFIINENFQSSILTNLLNIHAISSIRSNVHAYTHSDTYTHTHRHTHTHTHTCTHTHIM